MAINTRRISIITTNEDTRVDFTGHKDYLRLGDEVVGLYSDKGELLCAGFTVKQVKTHEQIIPWRPIKGGIAREPFRLRSVTEIA